MGEDGPRDQAAPEFIRHFELFRGTAPQAAEVLSDREAGALAELDGPGGLGLIASQARTVQLSPSVKVIAIPGTRGRSSSSRRSGRTAGRVSSEAAPP